MQRPTRVSTWFDQHRAILGPGQRVLDLACGEGRHALAAARLGARVLAVDRDPERLRAGQRRVLGEPDVPVRPRWVCADLETWSIAERGFDVVMGFNYLDRKRMSDFVRAVAPGGYFLYETFRDEQRRHEGGPRSDDHLLSSFELPTLVEPLEVVAYREILEFIDEKVRAIASVLAVRREDEG